MKINRGILAAIACFLAALAFWVVGYFGLPNANTHRILSQNPPVASSATDNSPATTASQDSASPVASAQSTFYALGKEPDSLALNLESGTNGANQGLNFDGYYNGNLVVTVPVGWKIDITYTNKDANMPHSVGITTWADRTAVTGFAPAFSQSIPSNFTTGITNSNPAMKLSITADKAGQYALVCGLPGHAVGGMWFEVDVSAAAKAPAVKTPSGTVTVK